MCIFSSYRARVKYSYEAIKKKRRRKKKRRETALCKKETLASFFVLSHSQIFLFCLKEKQRGPGRRDKKETNHEKIMGYVNGRRLITKRRVVTP